jgi:hypothetical protein
MTRFFHTVKFTAAVASVLGALGGGVSIDLLEIKKKS